MWKKTILKLLNNSESLLVGLATFEVPKNNELIELCSQLLDAGSDENQCYDALKFYWACVEKWPISKWFASNSNLLPINMKLINYEQKLMILFCRCVL